MPTKIIGCRLEEQELKKLKALQEETGLNTSQIVRRLINFATVEVIVLFPEKENNPGAG